MSKFTNTINKGRMLIVIFIAVFVASAVVGTFKVPVVHASGGITSVQSDFINMGTSGYIFLPSAPSSGDVIVATIGFHTYGTTTVSSISGTGVTWYIAVQTTVSNGANSYTSCIAYGIVGSGAGTVVGTVTFSDTNWYAGRIDDTEYSGLSTTPLDVYSSNSGSSVTADTGTTSVTTASQELWVGNIVVGNYALSSLTPTNGFTLIGGVITASTVCSAYLYKIVSSTGAANSELTISSQPWAGTIATFEAAVQTVSVTFTSNPAGSGFITVNGATETTPYTISAAVGAQYTIAAYSPANAVSGQSQYVFSSWSDSGAQSHTYTVPSGGGTVTAYFTEQFYLTVSGGYSTTGQGWINSGGTATASSSWVWNTVSGQSRTAITNWQLDGVNQNPTRSNTGTLTTSSITMSTYHTVNFVSATQYYLTVSGGNSVTYGTASPTADNWYDSGTSMSVSSSWVWNTVSSQSRTALTNWQLDGTNQNPTRADTGTLTTSSISMSTYHTVNFVSTTQYFLTVSGGNSVSFGTASPTSDQWYDSGTSTTVTSSWVWGTVSGQSRTAINNYAIDGSNQNPTRQGSGVLITSSVTMSTYHTVSFSSVLQFYLTVNGGNSISFGTASPTGDQWYDSGGSTTVSSNGIYSRSGGTGTRVSSWALDSGSNNNVATAGTVTTSSVSMSTYHTITFNTVTQYQVTLDSGATSALNTITNPTISGDSGWYDSGTSVTLVLNGVYGRSGGSGTRISGYKINAGSNNPETTVGSFAVLNAVSISSVEAVTTTTVTQYQVTLDSTSASALNSITSPTVSGDNYWYDSGTSISITLNGIYGRGSSQGTRITGYAINGGANNPEATTGTFNAFSGPMSGPEAVTTTTVTQYLLSVSGGNSITYGTASSISGDTGWYDSGSSTTVSSNWVWNIITGQSRDAINNYSVNGVNQNPTRQYTGTLTTGSLLMTTNQTVVFAATVQYYFSVISSNGAPTGAGWYDTGSSVTSTITTPVAGAGVQYVTEGWTGTGSLASGGSQGSSTTGSFTLTAPSSCVWNWLTQYRITPSSDSHSTISPSAALWVNSGGSQQFSFSPQAGYYISQVMVNGSSVSTSSPYTFSNVQANYVISVASNAYASLNLQTLDEQGNVLSGTTIYLNGTAYQTVNGQLQLTNLFPGTDFQGSVTWQGVDVNASFCFVINQNTAVSLTCTAYPFTLNSVLYELATDRAVISDTWDGTHFTIFFGASPTSNRLVFDSSQVPTYITGFSYDLSSDWNSNTDVFTCTLSNSTSQATINFDSWGSGFYLQEADTPISSASWTGLTFTIQLETNGTGTLIIHCSTRGVPTTVSGMVAVYDSTTTYLTGTYTDTDQIIIDWTQTSPTSGGSGGGSGSSSTIEVAISQASFGTITLGTNQTIDVSFTFAGTSLTVTGVQVTGNEAQYIKADTTFPKTYFGGSGTITLELDLPGSAAAGTYTCTLTVTGTDAFGTTHTASSSVTYTAQTEATGPTIQLPNNSMIMFGVTIGVISVVIVGSLAVLTRRKSR